MSSEMPDSDHLEEGEEVSDQRSLEEELEDEDEEPSIKSGSRRKRKMPQKVNLEGDFEPIEVHPDLSNFPISSIDDTSDPYMDSRIENSTPKRTCPVCGDKSNGLHYGIYSCEGCKNFFKRSVVTCQERPYICKFSNDCNVGIYDNDGSKRQRMRCQACRYQACLDAGMHHRGILRTRIAREGKGKLSSPPLSSNSVTISPVNFPDDSLLTEEESVSCEGRLKRFYHANIDLQHEIDKLKSKNRELSNSLLEKENQLSIASQQILNLKQSLKNSANVEKEMIKEIESLRFAGSSANFNPLRHKDYSNGIFNQSCNRAVTITPVIPCLSSSSKKNNIDFSSSVGDAAAAADDDMAIIKMIHSTSSMKNNNRNQD